MSKSSDDSHSLRHEPLKQLQIERLKRQEEEEQWISGEELCTEGSSDEDDTTTRTTYRTRHGKTGRAQHKVTKRVCSPQKLHANQLSNREAEAAQKAPGNDLDLDSVAVAQHEQLKEQEQKLTEGDVIQSITASGAMKGAETNSENVYTKALPRIITKKTKSDKSSDMKTSIVDANTLNQTQCKEYYLHSLGHWIDVMQEDNELECALKKMLKFDVILFELERMEKGEREETIKVQQEIRNALLQIQEEENRTEGRLAHNVALFVNLIDSLIEEHISSRGKYL